MNLRTVVVLAAIAALPAAASAQEHKCACCGNHASHAAAQPAPPAAGPAATAPDVAADYDVEYEGLFAGIVQSVMRHQGMDVQLTLGAGENVFEVIVAPMEWLDRQNVVFRTGETIHVVGTRQNAAAPNTIIAREVRSAQQTVVLRDETGRALWR
jgi:hypothetical protein